MTASGFSFSAALASAQTEKTSSLSTTEPQPAVPKAGGFSFAKVLATAQTDKPLNATSTTAKSTGFSMAGALSSLGAKANALETKSVNAAKLLAADNWLRGEVILRCVEKWHETHDVVSFRFQGIEPVKFNYKPGQFITFKLEIDGKPVYRSYTIASSPSRPYSLIVTIKKIDGGLVSNYLADQLNVDDEVTVVGPDGAFNLIDIQADKYLFLSAGSGVTPMYSMSRWLCDTTVGSDIAFVHSARSAEDIIFAETMATMAARCNSLALSYVLEDDSAKQQVVDRHPNIQCESGRLDIAKLTALVPDFQTRTVFICGPEPYMAAVKSMLQQAQFNMANFYQESFATAPKTASNKRSLSPSEHVASGGFMLKIAGKDFPIGSDQTLLEGIESEGLPIIAACRNGVCGACKCQVTEGSVTTSSTATLTADEIAAGFVLACSTVITSDVSLTL
ncbi:hybrid-cluster NAD(P)-dependent oxidoreductase [Shewanella sp. FYR11-62]|uniref:Hybrid-cluster NAD(P)-dependent oxidoreductase n=2 Tax=Shewanella subflava TaxID=2986476 RepID=A0ABT3I9V4_9GAMM|nr:hybrid-cluster NAD(P)-dependent oxidoreductase [Shewanella subflava]MCW3172813.1 hybrid-cluster NAD(P)-dependent oxidoreductase [Shewanella subflava]